MTVTEAICTGNARYQANQKLNPVGVVLHSIGCPQPDARVLRKYWQSNPYVTHYVLDDVRILHTMPNDRKCWHVGTPGNAKWLGIEMCEPKEIQYCTGTTFTVKDRAAARAYCEKTWQNAVWLLAKLCQEYGWNPETAILTHNEITRKGLSKTDHVDPEHLWRGLGLDYNLHKLRAAVKAAMPSREPAKNPDEPWLGRVTASVLNVRNGPGMDCAIVQNVRRNEVYTIVDEQDGWGKLKSGAGWVSLRYIKPIG